MVFVVICWLIVVSIVNALIIWERNRIRRAYAGLDSDLNPEVVEVTPDLVARLLKVAGLTRRQVADVEGRATEKVVVQWITGPTITHLCACDPKKHTGRGPWALTVPALSVKSLTPDDMEQMWPEVLKFMEESNE